MKDKFKINWFTVLLLINTVIFVLSFLVQNRVGFDDNLFYLFGGEIPSKIYAGSWWLLVTANFFHVNIIHFLFNIYSLYKIGEVVDMLYDGRKLFLTYILGGVGGTFLSYLIALYTKEDIFSLGASASIFALVGLLIGGSLKKYRYGLELPISLAELVPFAVISFLFGFLPGINVNNWAHLGGIITGLVIGLIVPHSLNPIKDAFENILTNLLYYISVIIFLLSYGALFYTAYNLLFK